MAKRIALSTLNASTIDILNVIRMNANAEYQNAVPEITKATDIPKVGEVIYGTPAFSNYFRDTAQKSKKTCYESASEKAIYRKAVAG